MRPMTYRKRRMLFSSACLIFLLSATTVADAGGWESVNEFTGWIRISRKVDFKTTISTGGEENAEMTVKDSSYAYIQATGTEIYGAYHRSTGRITGQINISTKLVGVQSGYGVERKFSGDISKKFSGETPVRCPKIKVNEEKRLYRVSFPGGHTKGIRIEAIVPSGQKKVYKGWNGYIYPHVPDRYSIGGDEGAPYDPTSSVISGNYSFTGYGKVESDGSAAVMKPDSPLAEALPEWMKCPIKYDVSWNFKIGKPDHKVTIIYPEANEQFVYDGNKELWIPSRAKAEPKSYNDKIRPWLIDQIEGSQLTTEPAPPVGKEVHFTFDELPYDNNQFGNKTISADTADPVTIKVFFGKNDKNNPGEFNNPNWFYYWKQGPVPGMEPFKYNEKLESWGMFVNDTGELFLGPNAATEDEPEMIHISTPKGPKVLRFPQSNGIDTCARTVAHELRHKDIYDRYHALIEQAHSRTPVGKWSDFDFDGLPDIIEKLWEPEIGINWCNPDTHNLKDYFRDPDYATYGDQELLCWMAELGVKGIHEQDWAWPGKQSDPPE